MVGGLLANPVSAQQSGPTLVKNINPGTCSRGGESVPCGSNPQGLTAYDGVLYFSAIDGETGRELWQYDGSTARLVKNINTNEFTGPGHYRRGGKPSSNPKNLTGYQGTLYFAASKVPSEEGNQKVKGEKLWGYDGTTVRFVKNLDNPTELTVYNDALYLVASSGEKGRGLWKYDGSRFRFVKAMSGLKDLVVYEEDLYFSALDRESELWKILSYDGSSVSLVKKYAGGSIESMGTVYDGALYYVANDGETGDEIWSYDGSSVSQLKDLNPGSGSSYPGPLTVYDDMLYFLAADGETAGLWKYNGSTVSMVTDASLTGFLTVYDGALYFPRNNGKSGTELYRYDGSTVSLAAEVHPGEEGSELHSVVAYDGALYFSANDGETGRELWRYQPE